MYAENEITLHLTADEAIALARYIGSVKPSTIREQIAEDGYFESETEHIIDVGNEVFDLIMDNFEDYDI